MRLAQTVVVGVAIYVEPSGKARRLAKPQEVWGALQDMNDTQAPVVVADVEDNGWAYIPMESLGPGSYRVIAHHVQSGAQQARNLDVSADGAETWGQEYRLSEGSELPATFAQKGHRKSGYLAQKQHRKTSYWAEPQTIGTHLTIHVPLLAAAPPPAPGNGGAIGGGLGWVVILVIAALIFGGKRK